MWSVNISSQTLLLYIGTVIVLTLVLVGVTTAVRIVVYLRNLRPQSGADSLKQIREDTTLVEGESEFLRKRAKINAELGLDHLFDAVNDIGSLRKLLSVWIVPGTGLFVADTRLLYRLANHVGVTEGIMVYTEGVPQRQLSVTNSQWYLAESKSTIEQSGVHVSPPDYETHQLIALAWALASANGRVLNRANTASGHMDYLKEEVRKQFERELESGAYKEAPDGSYRLPWHRVLTMLIGSLGILWGRSRMRARRKQYARDREAVSHLFDPNLSPPAITSAVQDRVRTGSTAPLTQP